MSKIRIIQLTVVMLFIAVTAWLYLLPISKNEVEKPAAPAVSTAFNFDNYSKAVKAQFRSSQLTLVNDLETKLAQQNSEQNLLALGHAWDEMKQPGMAAFYFEKISEQKKTERSYIDAAYRYFDAFKGTEDTIVKSEMVNRAINNYKKVLEVNPKNLDAKTDLGVCYTEGTGNPMQGIMMLREVIAENPNHENAQLNLGMLSVKSRQFEKALERFDKVLEINPARTDVYIFKAQTYLEMGDTTNAKTNFDLFLTNSKDEAMKENVKQFMGTLGK